ncbi:MAG: F420-dependent NADP oxidoreductase [Niabella sp.]
MRIVIIGSGNVAAILGRKLVRAGHKIVQVLSRNASAASELAYEWDTESANYTSLLNHQADVYIIAVADKAIEEIAKDIHLPGKVVVHTAASVPMDVLAGVTEHYGVLYPLQSIIKGQEVLPEIPFYTVAADDYTSNVLDKLAGSISSGPVYHADDDKRKKLHVAAVMVNNFINYILTLTEEYCKKEHLEFEALLPLLQNTITRLQDYSPADMQTGPAVRRDMATIAVHQEILQKHPRLLEVYNFMTNQILNG